MVKRIDKKDITDGTPLVLPSGHPDTVFLNPNNYISIKGTVVDYNKYQVSNPYSSPGDPTPDSEASLVSSTLTNQLDVPQLADIESITYQKYYDSVTKEEKVKATIKIRNSSKNPNNVAGVDARIYNPNA
jgi:hypothetical protein